MPHIVTLVGSLRSASINQLLALSIQNILSDRFTFSQADIGALPHYNEDDEANLPEEVQAFRDAIASADGILFVTPEYNRSVPGVLKNAIDQASRPKGKSAWLGKPAGLIGASPGVLGTCMAQQHLRNILAPLDVHVMGLPEAYVQVPAGGILPTGEIADERIRPFISTWSNAFAAWVERMKP
jgi:chromate reductase